MCQTGNGTSPHRNQTVWRGNKKLESTDKRVQPVDDASKTLCQIEKGAEQMIEFVKIACTIDPKVIIVGKDINVPANDTDTNVGKMEG
jgi:hypothetical protein